jgi:hypothetical protein
VIVELIARIGDAIYGFFDSIEARYDELQEARWAREAERERERRNEDLR